jgi:hypothetical protein
LEIRDQGAKKEKKKTLFFDRHVEDSIGPLTGRLESRFASIGVGD